LNRIKWARLTFFIINKNSGRIVNDQTVNVGLQDLTSLPLRDEDVARLSPFVHERHINLLGRYSFAVPEAVTRGELRPLRNPNDSNA